MPTRSVSKSQRRCSLKKSVLINYAKFTGKHLCQSLFLNKVAGLSPLTLLNNRLWCRSLFNKVAGISLATLLKKRLWNKCFPVNFCEISKNNFLQNTSGRLLLGLSDRLTFKQKSFSEPLTI